MGKGPRREVQQLMNTLQRSSDYESFVTSVTLRNDDFSVEEIEALLMAHESRVEKNNSSLDFSPSAHVASSNVVEKGIVLSRIIMLLTLKVVIQVTMVVLDEVETLVVEVASMVVVDSIGMTMEEVIEVVFVGRGNRCGFQARPPWNSDNQNEKPVCQLCGTTESVKQEPSPRAYYDFSPLVNGVIPTSEVFGDDNWYPDSGASNHVTPNPANLMKSVEFAGQNQVTQAVLMVGKVKDGLYAFDSSHLALRPTQSLLKSPSVVTSSFSSKVCTASLSSTFDLWHGRLGHPSAATIKNVLSKSSPPILSPTMLPTPTSPISSARLISEMDNVVSTHPHAPNSADTTPAPAQVPIREPSSVATALQQDEWKEAMVVEYDALQRNNTWSLVPLPVGRQTMGCKWVYKTKENPAGTVQKVVFTIALSRNWAIKQLDVNNVFLNGDLQEVFMQQPQGFIDEQNPNLVCRLHKALYGLKQAPRAWFEKLHQALLSFGFVSAKSDQLLFLRFTPSHITYVLVYVDDILVTSSDTAAITSLIAQLSSEFSLKDLGEVHYFLGIQVSHTNNGLHLSQTKYIRDLLQKTKMVHCKLARIPLPTGLKLRAEDGDPMEDLHGYREYNRSSSICDHHKGTLQHGLHLKKSSSLDLVGFCDADWASDLDDRRSTSGHCAFLGANLISCNPRNNILFQGLVLNLNIEVLQVCTVLLSANPVLHAGTKHIELDLYFVREKVI
ncbi:Retrovirus-related Pol polyprotein from transposon RE1 [Vitis vinifera]|uniref:Retrovirus-related Pol polyprotein from transposon RE1 n=1 Tax=Vitis vinifera TaxID=29760 RepID=A0A438GWQ8_VITVI|nr:Retrovirus-related Pol polyprotein from transposon RE1 [Vitis vinifera]